MKKLTVTLLALLMLLCACSPAEPVPAPQPEGSVQEEETSPPPKPAASAEELYIAHMLNALTAEEKVGQLFFVRCPTANAAEDVSTYHLGGYLLFLRDFQNAAGDWLTAEEFTATVESYQQAAEIPLLIGVDEEGGTVTRASRNPNLFSTRRKSPQQVYAAGGLSAIAQDSFDYNSGLLRYGINVNFAPVCDLSTDPGDFIYARSFGQDAAATAEYIQTAVSWMNQCRVNDELRKIGSVLKHFPGYGDNVDTHTGIAVDKRPYEQFAAEDFLPFRAGIESGAGCVLVSHNIVTCMDAEFPASLSPEVHRVLRQELGFEGVILTDDLAMGAINAYAKDGSAAVLAVLAGNDMIVTTDYRSQIPQVLAAVQDGRISPEMLDAAVSRILRWKLELGLITLS